VKVVLTQLPARITPGIGRVCSSIGLQGSPVFVRVEPARDADSNRCIYNVRRAAERGDGEVVLGWKILEWPRVLVQFIGHAVLRNRERLLCITLLGGHFKTGQRWTSENRPTGEPGTAIV
jgi:hypothetical protein